MLYTSNTFVPYNYPLKESEIVFLGIPFTSTSISKPAMYGPVMVRHALQNCENLPNKKFCDLGDLEIVPGSYELTAERIRETVKEMLQESKAFPIFIGGEHLITLPIIETLKPATIIQLDAHSDTRKDYLGCEFSHSTWAFHASKVAHIAQIGLNALSDEEREFLKNTDNVKSIRLEDFSGTGIKKPVHLTIDIDVLKSCYVETGFPEGKYNPEEILSFLEKISPDSMDIVEIADTQLPSKSGFIAAEMIKTILKNKFKD